MSRAINLILHFIFILATVHTLIAQDYRANAHRYSIEDGLPHRQVNAVIQDRRGLIWMATPAGVARFDGYRFSVFTKTENGLSSIAMDWLLEDAAGYIWAIARNSNGSIASIDIIEPVSGTVIPGDHYFKNQPVPVPVERLQTYSCQGSDGAVYFGMSDPAGWVRYHPDTGWEMTSIQQAGKEFRIIKVTDQQHIWGLLKENGDDGLDCLVEFDANSQQLHRYMPHPGNKFRHYEGETGEANGFFVVENAPDWHDRLFWQIKSDGSRMQVFPPTSPAGESTSMLALLEGGDIWFNEQRLFHRKNKVILDLKKLYPELVRQKKVCWLKDRQGKIWVGTSFGLILIDIRKDHFRRLLYDATAPAGTGIACRGLLEYNGRLWVNSEQMIKGRFVVDLSSGVATTLPEGGYVYGITVDNDQHVWTDAANTGNMGTYISPMDPFTGTLYEKIKTPGKNWHIFPENEQRLLLGSEKGIYAINPINKEITSLSSTGFPELETANVVYIGRDRRGNVWACAETGFYRITVAGIAERCWMGGKGAAYLPVDDVLHFYEDGERVFWISTRGGGLLRWDQKTGEKKLLFRNAGILNGNIYAVYEDDFNHLWMPTDYGIVQFEKATLSVKHTWLVTDGLTQNEFNRTSHTQGSDGTLYFGGLNGVTAFHPKVFYNENNSGKHQFQLVLSNLTLLKEDGSLLNQTADVVRSRTMELYPGDRYLQIEFALLDFVNVQNATYSWKIVGMDADWTYLRKPELRLSSLPSGEYQLRIRAQAADGKWAGNELQFQLKVMPPFYLRGWFLLLVLAMVSAGAWSWHRRNIWQREKLERTVALATAKIQEDKTTIEQQAAELRQLDEAKSRFFTNISHELRTPLTLMLGPITSVMRSKTLDPANIKLTQLAYNHGKNLLGLVNQILDLSKLDAGKLELQESTVLLFAETGHIVSMFESHAQQLGIRFDFRYKAEKKLQVEVDLPKLNTILNNLLSNALKFTPPGGEVAVEVDDLTHSIRIHVSDNGRGIHPDDLPHLFDRFYQTTQPGAPLEGGTGIGLALSHELAMLMQGSLTVESRLNEGSTFTLEIPRKETFGAPDLMAYTAANDRPPVDLSEVATGDKVNKNAPAILIVEDNPDLRSYLHHLLSDKYHIETAVNGQIALDLLKAGIPNCQLIISDLMMPVMDGYQLLEKLKSDDRYRHIPVVMLTARADTADKLRALRIGVDDYLFKPFETDELLARIENLLANYNNRIPASPAENGQLAELAEKEGPSVYSVGDQEWLERLETLVMQSLSVFDLNAETLASQMFTSRSQLFRRVKQLTGLNVSEYIQEIRFQQARILLEQKKYATVKAVALSVGFKHANNFAINYKKRFGKAPVSYF